MGSAGSGCGCATRTVPDSIPRTVSSTRVSNSSVTEQEPVAAVCAMYARDPVLCAYWFIRRAFRGTGSAWSGTNMRGNQGSAASEQSVGGLGTWG